MSQSHEINELAAALVAAQAEFAAVPKGSVNPFFKSKYAALPDVVASASPVLAKHGLAISQFITMNEPINGGVNDALTTYLIHQSGQYISHTMRLHLVKDDPQAQGSAVTYARRYSYMSALGLVADVDDDGNAGSKQSAPAPKKESGHSRVGGLLAKKIINKDDRKVFVTDTLGREVEWASLSEADLAQVELALATF